MTILLFKKKTKVNNKKVISCTFELITRVLPNQQGCLHKHLSQVSPHLAGLTKKRQETSKVQTPCFRRGAISLFHKEMPFSQSEPSWWCQLYRYIAVKNKCNYKLFSMAKVATISYEIWLEYGGEVRYGANGLVQKYIYKTKTRPKRTLIYGRQTFSIWWWLKTPDVSLRKAVRVTEERFHWNPFCCSP